MLPESLSEPKRLPLKVDSNKKLARIYKHLSLLEYENNNVMEAIGLQEKAIAWTKKGLDIDSLRLGELYRTLGKYFIITEQWEKAKNNFFLAIDCHIAERKESISVNTLKCFGSLCYIEKCTNSLFHFDTYFKGFETMIQGKSVRYEDLERNKEFCLLYSKMNYHLNDRNLIISKYSLSPLFSEYYELINEFEKQDEYQQAINIVNRILELIDKHIATDFENKIRALLKLAMLKRLIYQPEEAKVILEKVEKIFSSSQSVPTYYLTNLVYEYGQTEQQLGNLQLAKKYFLKAIELNNSELIKNTLPLSVILFSLAEIEYELNNYKSARIRLLQCLESIQSNRSGSDFSIARVYEKLALIELALNGRDQAKTYFLLAIEQSGKKLFPDYKFIASLYQRLSKLEIEDQNEQKSLEYKLKYYENNLLDPEDSVRLTILNYFHRAKILFKMGNLDFCQKYLELALSLYPNMFLGDIRLFAKMNTLFGLSYLKSDRFNEAIRYLNRTLKVIPSWVYALVCLSVIYKNRKSKLDPLKEQIILDKLAAITQNKELLDYISERRNELSQS